MTNSSAKTNTEINHILVVDDLPDNCFLLQTLLESEGYLVEVAYSGRAALESIASHPPDLVLLDVMMPDINGFEVTRCLRQNLSLPYIPILLVTGCNEPTFDAGADGFIRKPINFDDLLHKICTILQPRSLTDLL